MAGVTKEEIALAKELDLLTYFKLVEPGNLKLVGKEYRHKVHSSLTISKDSLWCWHCIGLHGRTALKYLIDVEKVPYVEAVREINRIQGGVVHSSQPVSLPQPRAEPEAPRDFKLPQLDEDIPYTAQMIATITRQQIGTVERALQIFLKLGLVEVLDSGTFYMSNIELLIGQSSTEAERKRAARLQNKALSALRTSGGHLSDIRPPEIEIELEKEIEIKREIEKVRPETGHPSHTYGRYQNVFLTDEELADLQASFPAVWEQYIEKLSEYMASTGKRYQSHAATIRRWAGEDAKKTVTPSRNRDYSVKEDETV